MASLIQSTPKSIKMLRSTECRKIWWPMETAERDFLRGLAQALVAAEKATDDDLAAEIDKFKP
jgi:hypothetical protein